MERNENENKSDFDEFTDAFNSLLDSLSTDIDNDAETTDSSLQSQTNKLRDFLSAFCVQED